MSCQRITHQPGYLVFQKTALPFFVHNKAEDKSCYGAEMLSLMPAAGAGGFNTTLPT